MLIYPEIDPVALQLGPLKIHWYGLTYLIGFAAAWWLGRLRARRSHSGWSEQQVGDLIFYGALGVVLGGRIGYVLFYDFASFAENPLRILQIWQGGMSFHGGLIGVLVGMWLFGRRYKKTFFDVTDFLAPIAPIGLGIVRIGNFINGELWGRVSDVPWAMVFPGAGPLPRHPSQLYESFLEGAVLFTVVWLFSSKPRPIRAASGMFLLGYGVFRSLVELVRMPDPQLGYIAFGWVTQGQILSLPMIIAGAVLLWLAYRRKEHTPKTVEGK